MSQQISGLPVDGNSLKESSVEQSNTSDNKIDSAQNLGEENGDLEEKSEENSKVPLLEKVTPMVKGNSSEKHTNDTTKPVHDHNENGTNKNNVQEITNSSPLIEKHLEDQKSHPIYGKSHIILNLFFVALVWFGIFTAYNALEVLQSSLNPEYGVISISVIYICKIFTSLLGPLIVRKLTPKWSMVIGGLFHTVYIVANAYPEWYTLIPAGILAGIAMGPLWICLGVYITSLSVLYSEITETSKAAVLSKFNGIIMATMPLTFIVGNLISSAILQNVRFGDDNNEVKDIFTNISTTIVPDVHSYIEYTNTMSVFNNELFPTNSTIIEEVYGCGPNYCPESRTGGSKPGPNRGAIYVLLAVLGVFNLTGVLVGVFGLDNIPASAENSTQVSKNKVNACQNISNYLKSFFEWRFLLLIPSTVYIHVTLALIGGTFTKAYVTCNVGIGMVGYISMTRGITGIVTNAGAGIIGQYVNRNFIFVFSLILTVIQCALWLLWESISYMMVVLFVSAAIGGIANGANLTQYTSFLGDAFTEKKTEVFSFYHFWAGIAVALGFLQNNYLCVKYQIYIFLVITFLGIVTYSILCVYLNKHKRPIAELITQVVTDEDHKMKAIIAKDTVSPKHKTTSNLMRDELQAMSASQVSLSMV